MCSMGKCLGLVVFGALLLTGCATGEPEAAAPTVTVTATPEATGADGRVEVSAATPKAEPSEEVDTEAYYLRAVKETWRTEVPADIDLLSAADLACEQMVTGVQPYELDIITGGTPENNAWHSSQVGTAALSIICPEVVTAP